MSETASLTLTADLLRAYSRRGNFHSDPEAARELGLPGLVAQGMQVIGPAYGLLLDAWGDEFLGSGEIDVRFVGMVTADETVDAVVQIEGASATVTVDNRSTGHVAAVGSATRSA